MCSSSFVRLYRELCDNVTNYLILSYKILYFRMTSIIIAKGLRFIYGRDGVFAYPLVALFINVRTVIYDAVLFKHRFR